jgi:hypothetical protein
VGIKTTRITVETETLMIVRRAKAALSWCPDCRADVDVITIDDSLAEPVAAARVQEWLGTGKLHLWQPAYGPAQICVTSLLQCFESEEVQRFCRSSENPLDELRRKQK